LITVINAELMKCIIMYSSGEAYEMWSMKYRGILGSY